MGRCGTGMGRGVARGNEFQIFTCIISKYFLFLISKEGGTESVILRRNLEVLKLLISGIFILAIFCVMYIHYM